MKSDKPHQPSGERLPQLVNYSLGQLAAPKRLIAIAITFAGFAFITGSLACNRPTPMPEKESQPEAKEVVATKKAPKTEAKDAVVTKAVPKPKPVEYVPTRLTPEMMDITTAAPRTTPVSEAAASDDFTDEEWDAIVRRAKQLGIIHNAADADRLAPTLYLMKSIFVKAGITHPTARQLFSGVDFLTGGGFRNSPAEQVEKSLRMTVILAKQANIPVATREQLEQLGKGDVF